MNERLEEIKTRFNAMKELESFKKLAPTDLFFDDLNWLLQQAEQNQRYKQALEFYADEENYEPLNMEVGAMTKDGYKVAKYRSEPKIEMDKGEKARQALGTDKP